MCVCIYVCLSVTYHSRDNIAHFYTHVEAYFRLFSVFNMWIFNVTFRSEVIA